MSKRISWAVRLERAEANEGFSRYEKKLADSWRTCAVGEKHNHGDGAFWIKGSSWHLSDEYKYGIEFMYAVKDDDIFRAKDLYTKLQALP